MTDLNNFQRTVFNQIRDKVNFDRSHYGTAFSGHDVSVSEMLEFKPLGAEYSAILGEHTMHWFVRTDLTEDGIAEKAAWHVTLYEDGNMSIKLLEIEKQN